MRRRSYFEALMQDKRETFDETYPMPDTRPTMLPSTNIETIL